MFTSNYDLNGLFLFSMLFFFILVEKMSESMFYLHKMYFLYNSTFAHRIFKAWQEKYSVCNIYENDVQYTR